MITTIRKCIRYLPQPDAQPEAYDDVDDGQPAQTEYQPPNQLGTASPAP
jgi:hypothetical protein